MYKPRKLAYGPERPDGLGFAWAVAAPIIASGLTSVGAAIWSSINQRGARKEATTQIVNTYEPYLQQNVAAWEQSGKTVSEQAYALKNFDDIWGQVKAECGQGYGDPGRWCVEDRQRGGQFDWFRRYRDPIANDPNVQPDPTTEEVFESTVSRYIPEVGGLPSIAVLGGGLVALGLVLAILKSK